MRDNFGRASLQRGNTASGLLIGLLIGVAIAVVIALYINFGPKPFTSPLSKTDTTTPAKPAQSAVPPAPQGVIALPGKPGDQPMNKPAAATPTPAHHGEGEAQSTPVAAVPEKNKFDFYKILPAGDAASAPAPSKPEPVVDNKVFVQVASLQNPSEADNLKARLALMGVEAKVQRVDLPDKGVFYRVRLGPYESTSDADAVRGKLATEGIESSVVRSNPTQAAAKKP